MSDDRQADDQDAVAPLEGAWSYVVVDDDVVYWPGLYPFTRRDRDERLAQLESAMKRAAKRDGWTYTPPASSSGVFPVQLAPDTTHRACGKQDVRLWPSWDNPNIIFARLHVTDRSLGTEDGCALPVVIEIDAAAKTATVPGTAYVPARLRPSVELKARRLLEFIARESGRRDAGAQRPISAHDRHSGPQGR